MDEKKTKLQRIFAEAIQIESPEELQKFLDRACDSDAPLLTEVKSLLKAYQAAASFMEQPIANVEELELPEFVDSAHDETVTRSEAILEGPSALIGPYKLLQVIGEGGMGSVYMAQQEQPVRRRVALKIIKAGMDSKQVIARFEAERQALAMMDHANIAHVLDAGTTNQGRPYFVMELIKGVPITRYCDNKNLNVDERLHLFKTVCQAVQHAHHKGIIHRDLKPSNILVAEYDGKPVPKIIDFGLAKALHQTLTDKTLFTQFGQVLGTLEYMSPEQSSLNQLAVDTRTDIYSLGVLLYELLTGSVPLEKQRLCSVAFDQILKIIREEEPPKPSVRLSTSKSSVQIARQRGTEANRLSLLLRGDLDWIVMKAINKDRSRRYETATGFSNDVRRYLDNELVEARPPTSRYRIQKFIQRNRLGVAAALLIGLTLVVGVIGTSSGMFWALEQQQVAQQEAEQRRRTLYVAHMGSVQWAWERGMIRRVRELLDTHLPGKDKPDLRTFEWHYYDRLCKQALLIPTIEFGEKISSLAIGADDKTLALVGDDERLDIWDINSGKKLQELADKYSIAKRLLFSKNGSVLLSIGGQFVSAWKRNEATSLLEVVLQRQADQPSLSIVSSDGRFVVLVLEKSIWCFDSINESSFELKQPGKIEDICFFDPNHSIIISHGSESNDARLELVDLRTQAGTDIYTEQGSSIRRMLLSENRKRMVAMSEDEANVFQLDQNGMLSNPIRLKMFPSRETDLRRLETNQSFIAVDGNTMSSWRYDSPDRIARFSTVESFPRRAEFGRNGLTAVRSQFLAVCESDPIVALNGINNRVQLLDGLEFDELGSLHGHANTIQGIEFRKNGGLLTCSRDQTVKVWKDLSFEDYEQFSSGTDQLWSVAISPDNSKIATASKEARVTIWNLETGKRIGELPSSKSIQFVRFSPDGNSILFGGDDALVHVYDLSSLREIMTLKGHSGTVNSFGFSGDGKYLATGSDDSSVVIWDWRTGEIVKSLTVKPEQAIWAVAFSPTDNCVVFGGTDDTVRLWNFENENTFKTLITLNENVTSLNYSNDGAKLAITTADGVITLWDNRSSTAKKLIAHSSAAMSTAFSPDVKTLVSGSSDGNLQFWNMATLEPTISIKSHAVHIHAVYFSNDGTMVATASWDGSVKVFRSK